MRDPPGPRGEDHEQASKEECKALCFLKRTPFRKRAAALWGGVAASIRKREGEEAGNQETSRPCEQDSFLTKSLQPLPG